MSALPMTLNTTAETETAKIARGLRDRDMELFADLVGRCQHRLVRYLLYLTGRREYAEDLAQETWIRVLQRGSQYNGRQRFDPWLFAIARNLAIDYLRKKRKAVATVSFPNDRDAMLLLPLPILPHSKPRPEAKTQCVWPAACRFCHRCIARLCC
jgi:RNA polymerase sigma-70 factor (ECF subfamily)